MVTVPDDIRPAMVAAAAQYELESNLVEAVILKESSGDPYAWNPEPKYRYLWDVRANKPFRRVTAIEAGFKFPPPDFRCLKGDPDQEWWAQQASWGLMQIMGAVARELQFKGPYLTALTEVRLNLDLGCSHLKSMLQWANNDHMKALAAYNGGRGGWADAGPQEYAQAVNKILNQL